VTGLVAWTVTLAPVPLSPRAPLSARVIAFTALGVGLAGTLSLATRPRLGRALGIGGFLALSCLSWALASASRVGAAVDPVRGFLGVLAWALYAASWSHPWSVPDDSLTTAPDGETRGLSPRRPPPRAALAVGALGGVGALLCLALSYRVDDPTRSLFARALAILAGVLLVSHSATLATIAGREERDDLSGRFPNDGNVARLLFAAVMLVGAILALARMP
jgi:hypothetical protein